MVGSEAEEPGDKSVAVEALTKLDHGPMKQSVRRSTGRDLDTIFPVRICNPMGPNVAQIRRLKKTFDP